MNIAKYARTLSGGALVAAGALLAGCVVTPAPTVPPSSDLVLAAPPTTNACLSCGIITAIQGVGASGYSVTLRMEDGSMRTLTLPQQPAFQVGDRVQILTRTSSPPQ